MIDDESLQTNQTAACKTHDEIIKVLDREDNNDKVIVRGMILHTLL